MGMWGASRLYAWERTEKTEAEKSFGVGKNAFFTASNDDLIVEWLLGCGAYLKGRNNKGDSTLHYAASAGNARG